MNIFAIIALMSMQAAGTAWPPASPLSPEIQEDFRILEQVRAMEIFDPVLACVRNGFDSYEVGSDETSDRNAADDFVHKQLEHCGFNDAKARLRTLLSQADPESDEIVATRRIANAEAVVRLVAQMRAFRDFRVQATEVRATPALMPIPTSGSARKPNP